MKFKYNQILPVLPKLYYIKSKFLVIFFHTLISIVQKPCTPIAKLVFYFNPEKTIKALEALIELYV